MSQLSTASTIPYEETQHLNPDLVFELDEVVELYPLVASHVSSNDESLVDLGDDDDDDDDWDNNGNGDDDNDGDDDISDDDIVEQNRNQISLENDDEQLKQDAFKAKGCGCKLIHSGKPCSEVVNWQDLINYRLSCFERTRDELDILVKVQLFHHRNAGEKTNRNKDRVKVRQNYIFGGIKVCRDLFAFAHGLNRKTIDAISCSLNNDGFEPRRHGNRGKVKSNAFSLNDIKAVLNFLQNYATQYGMPLPGRLANYKQEKAKLLPSDKSKGAIYELYCRAVSGTEYQVVGLSTFKSIWSGQCPNIIVMRPATDLCLKCQMYVRKISNSAGMSEEEKESLTEHYSTHIRYVKMQRDNYRTLCTTSEESFSLLELEYKLRGQPPCSQEYAHYSFDYAQQVFYPHYAQQVGPLFFKTPRKCQCFGVACEASGSQIFYLLDEAYSSYGKGANSVASMVHDHFSYSFGESKVELHMDNCSGQNKNNTLIGYSMWRVMNGLHESIQLNMMEAGHTKFAPDWHFGLWKVHWKRADAESMEDIARSVQSSSKKGCNVPRIVDDSVVFYDWGKLCKANFKPLPGLRKYHHFRMSVSAPGKVFVREHASDEEVEIDIMKKKSNVIGAFPERLVPAGLDAQRQWYLYDEIAPLCHNTDKACPKPMMPKPKKIKLE